MRTIAFIAAVTVALADMPATPQIVATRIEAAAPASTSKSGVRCTTTVGDANFVNSVGQAGLMEIESGQLAKTNSTNSGVQAFGYLMITNHSLLNQDLEPIAKKLSLPFPTSVDGSQQTMLDHLKPLKGTQFDSPYLSDMVSGHTMAVQLFELEMKMTVCPQLESYARKYLPMIKEHLRLAQNLQNQGK